MYDILVKKLNFTSNISEYNNSQLASPLVFFPIFSLFGLITNAINIMVFSNSKMKDISFKYMLVISYVHIIYSGLSIYNMIIYCEECLLNKMYESQFYKIIITYYFNNSLAMVGHCCELFISVHRYLQLKNIKCLDKIPIHLMIIIFFIISLIYYSSELLVYDIMDTKRYLNNSLFDSTYTTMSTPFGKTLAARIIVIVQSMFRAFLTIILIPLINIGIIFEFNKRFKNRIKTKLKYRAEISKL